MPAIAVARRFARPATGGSMRPGLASVLLAASLAAAGCTGGGEAYVDGGSDTPEITSIAPDYGSIRGGSRVVVTGNGFLREGASPNRVVIGGREAPLAQAIDDNTLEVVVPPGDAPGDVDVVVFNANGTITAPGAFRYSTGPAITDIGPPKVRYDEGGTVTVTGSGFLDEDAGVNMLLVDGAAALDLEIVSDTELTFTAAPGTIFERPDLRLFNARGEAEQSDAFEYGPGPQGGLFLWARQNPTIYGAFLDPLTLQITSLPRRVRGGFVGESFHSVVRDAIGVLYGYDRQQRRLRRIDISEQSSEMVPDADTSNICDMARIASDVYVVDKGGTGVIGTIDFSTGLITQLGTTTLPGGQGCALAGDSSGILYLVQGGNLYTVSRSVGTLSAPLALNPSLHVTGMRFLGATLYAITNGGQLHTINTSTGATQQVLQFNALYSAMETAN
jgi:hypothetical protein